MLAANMVVFRQKEYYSGKSGCNQAKVVVFWQIWSCLGKVVIFGQCGCIRAKWLYSGKNGCIRAKVVVFG